MSSTAPRGTQWLSAHCALGGGGREGVQLLSEAISVEAASFRKTACKRGSQGSIVLAQAARAKKKCKKIGRRKAAQKNAK